MDVTDVQAESSPATVSVVNLTAEQRSTWRKTGEMPTIEDKPKAAPAPAKKESSAAETSAKDGESGEAESTASAPEAEESVQGPARKRGTAETRLQEILSDLKRAGLSPSELKTFKKEIQKHQANETQAASSTAAPEKAEPQTYAEWRKTFKADKWTDEWSKEHSDQPYEEAIAAMNDHLDEVRSRFRQREQATQAQQTFYKEQLAEAKKRYPDTETVIKPTLEAITSDESVHPVVKAMVGNSPVMVDLLYTLGGDEAAFAEFLELARTNPLMAVRKAVLMEDLVMKELADKKETARAEDGKFVKSAETKTPEKKVTSAPPPGKEVGTKSTPPDDELDAAEKRGDWATVRRLENLREVERRRKGVR